MQERKRDVTLYVLYNLLKTVQVFTVEKNVE